MRNASFTLDLLTLPKCWMTVRIPSAAVGHSRPSFFRPDYRLCSLNVIICTWKAAGELGDFLHTVVHGNPNNPKGPSFLSISLFVHL